ncbi:DUF4267 domain-containing protein [Isoptericola sp. NEAU-Y5]|uniref:DUF4267 domain-containing protein n=1 Tax=Isoptericola luteus TaxID=2879484 RepID=A0ABS7ZB41_9MICO|nr:DUF4267 domain-containing protein [Isoptericola sp. NEAU-Y5]MCA5892276.1 DUF4267 domain-containing protein [Isoptericola sp. NEAU-Y5]
MIATVATVVAGSIAAAVVLMGVSYVWAPGGAAGFGIPDVPVEDRAFRSWSRVKGNRDIGTGLLLLVVLVGGPPQLLGAAMIVAAVMPACDAVTVARAGGPPAAAYGVHAATAAVMVAVGLVLLGA